MTDPIIHINARDCLPFTGDNANAGVLQEFIESQSRNVFWFTPGFAVDEDAKLAEYDYRNNQWVAGRFIGQAYFSFNEVDYKITIKPRFGEKVLFRMLEEIFNIRITESLSKHEQTRDWQHYIKRILAFIWLQKLANANFHGLPKKHTREEYKGGFIKGRLEIRKSVKSYCDSNQVVSTNKVKIIDPVIAQIVHQAYSILKTDFAGGNLNIPDSAQDAINQVSTTAQYKVNISENEYKNIRYKEIYHSWKSLVDFSWDIIKRKQLSLKQKKAQNGFGFFIDMAEVWEQYLRSILKKGLLPYGWHYHKERQIAYKGYFYGRELIPDLIFRKENSLAVWDAKFKRMLGRRIDVDRSDFFQIHTYIQHFAHHKNVKAGGLLYPISCDPVFENYRSPYLLHAEGKKMNFSINGVKLSEDSGNLDPGIEEVAFIRRIVASLE